MSFIFCFSCKCSSRPGNKQENNLVAFTNSSFISVKQAYAYRGRLIGFRFVCVCVCAASMKPIKQSHWQQLCYSCSRGGLMVLRSHSVQTGGVSSASQFSSWLSVMATELPACVIINSSVVLGGNFSFVSSWFLSPFQLCRSWSLAQPHRCSILYLICFLFIQDENIRRLNSLCLSN